jgi:hypothetical protein
MVTEDLAVTAGPLGGVPDAIAVFLIDPALTSAERLDRLIVAANNA